MVSNSNPRFWPQLDVVDMITTHHAHRPRAVVEAVRFERCRVVLVVRVFGVSSLHSLSTSPQTSSVQPVACPPSRCVPLMFSE
eukprot:1196691-Amphidinium_carterae.1